MVQFCSGLHITADIFNEAFNIYKRAVCGWGGVVTFSAVPSSSFFSLFLPYFSHFECFHLQQWHRYVCMLCAFILASIAVCVRVFSIC